jgi:hypothetical protein
MPSSPAATGFPRAPSIPDILVEHLEETGFLSLQRRKLLFSDEATPAQLTQHDRRIEAHWAGLRVAPEDSAEIARSRLDDPGSAWDVMACARAWIELGSPKPEAILQLMAGANDDHAGGWREAFRRMPADVFSARIPFSIEASPSPIVQGILVDAHAWHGLLSPTEISEFAGSANPAARRAVARSAYLTGTDRTSEILDVLTGDSDDSVKRPARWSSLLANPARMLGEIRSQTERGEAGPFRSLVASLLVARDDDALRGKDAHREVSLWRMWVRAVLSGNDPLGIRHEVPDGFFSGVLSDESIPGE